MHDPKRIRVWDLPTRLFHWLLVAAFTVAFITHDRDTYLDVHVFAGYLFFGLLLFRLLWGVIGSHYARFGDFVYRWNVVRDYLKSLFTANAQRYLGHNPAGGWAVVAFITLGLVISVSGLLALGGEERHGPLAGLLSFEQGHLFKGLHEMAGLLMLLLVVVHILGVVVESVLHRENLIAAMISGHKHGTGPSSAQYGWTGLLLLAVALLAGAWYLQGHVVQTPDNPYLPFVGPQLPDNALWREECGSCHLAFHPSLLPARSWEAMLAEQATHFGDDLMLDAATADELLAFLTKNSAETRPTEAAWKINRLIPAEQTPRRITATSYWERKHAKIDDSVWESEAIKSKANCPVCHLDAEQGTFEDAAMRMPEALRDTALR
jgi:cytochrome b